MQYASLSIRWWWSLLFLSEIKVAVGSQSPTELIWPEPFQNGIGSNCEWTGPGREASRPDGQGGSFVAVNEGGKMNVFFVVDFYLRIHNNSM